MIVLKRHLFLAELRKRGFASVGEFCALIGVHRNSLSRYLSGASLLPAVLEKAFNALGTPVLSMLEERSVRMQASSRAELSKVVGALVQRRPSSAVVLFGSRAKGSAQEYSHYDLGIVAEKRLELEEWSDLRELVETECADLPYKIDLVDLRRADQSFLKEVAKNFIFLGGNPLQLRVLEQAHDARN